MDELDELATGMQNGEAGAFEAFAVQVGALLLRDLLRAKLTPAGAEALAVSLVSDLALKIDRFESRGPGSFRAWLKMSARNAVTDHFRARRLTSLSTLETVLAAPDFLHNNEVNGSEALTVAVQREVANLPTTDRDVLTARLERPDASFAEIGAALGVSEGTARTRQHRAMRRLKAALEADRDVMAWMQKLHPEEDSRD